MTEFQNLVTSFFTGTTVYITTRSLPTAFQASGDAPFSFPTSTPSPSFTLVTDGPFTDANVETITSTFISTLVFTGISLETHTISPTVTFSSSGSDTAKRGRSDTNRNLARILPAVILPLAFVIVLVYVVLRRYRHNPRWKRLPPVPFTSPATSTTSLSQGTGGNLYTRAGKAGMRHVQVVREPASSPAIVVANQGRSTGAEPNGTSDPAEQGNQAIGHYPVPPGMTMPELVVVPEIQAEILDIRARLADIESREPLVPPPLYSSEC